MPSFVQVPPQSTGKRVATETRKELYFDNYTGVFRKDDIVVGSISGTSGTVSAVITEGFAVGAGQLYLSSFSGEFQNNEELQVGGQTQAIFNRPTDNIEFDVQKVTISDANNLKNNLLIDNDGAARTTFTDGAPLFDPFGTLTVGEPQVIQYYRFANDSEPARWWDTTAGGGTIVWEGQRAAMLLSCGTANGDVARRKTNYYHPYTPGVGLNMEVAIQVGDTGKANVVRRWGYYDDENGFFFQLDGTEFSVCKRSNTTGSVVDTIVTQENFNGDRLDGSNAEAFDLDVTKANTYWIDLQWYGAGRVRMGVYDTEGARIVAHKFEHGNTSMEYPYTRTGSLPITISQENTGASVSTSELRYTGSVVRNTSQINITGQKSTLNSPYTELTQVGTEVALAALRPKVLYNGFTNRGITRLVSIGLSNTRVTGGGAVLFRIRFGLASQISGGSWASHGDTSIVEENLTPSGFTAGSDPGVSIPLAADNSMIVQDQLPRDVHNLELHLFGDGLTQPVAFVTAELLSGTSAGVMMTANWEEFKL